MTCSFLSLDRLLSALTLLLHLSAITYAATSGSSGAPFLRVPMSARAASLSGAFAGVYGDLATIEYNPAGLSWVERGDLNATFISHFEDSSFQSLGIAFPVKLEETIRSNRPAAEMVSRKVYVGFHYRSFRANDTARSDVGLKLDTFQLSDQLLQAGIAYPVMSRLSLGASAKFISREIKGKSASNYAVDAGFLWKLKDKWNLGAAVQNLGPAKAFVSDKEDLPSLVRAGVSYQPPRLLVNADVIAQSDGVLQPALGLEWQPVPLIGVRSGLIKDEDIIWSAGLGVHFNGPRKAAARPIARVDPTTPSGPSELRHAAVVSKKVHQLVRVLHDRYTTSDLVEPTANAAVLPLVSSDPPVARVFTNLIRDEFAASQKLALVERAEVEKAVSEQQYHLSGAVEQEKAVRIGTLLATDFVVVGSVEKIEDEYIVNARLIHVEDGKLIGTSYENVRADAFQAPAPSAPSPVRNHLSDVPVSEPTSLQLGLDYSIRTIDELGLSHTFTFKILF